MSDPRDLTSLSRLDARVTQDVCRFQCENEESGTCAYYALDENSNQCVFWSNNNALNTESEPLDVTNSVNEVNEVVIETNEDEVVIETNEDEVVIETNEDEDANVDDADADDADEDADADEVADADADEADQDEDAVDDLADQVATITTDDSETLSPHGVASQLGAPIALVGKEMPLDQHRLVFPNVRMSYFDAIMNRKCL